MNIKNKNANNKFIKETGGLNMNFIKGVLVGTAISAGAMMLYLDASKSNKKKWMKQGKDFLKKMEM